MSYRRYGSSSTVDEHTELNRTMLYLHHIMIAMLILIYATIREHIITQLPRSLHAHHSVVVKVIVDRILVRDFS
jgi:hypothetical protein